MEHGAPAVVALVAGFPLALFTVLALLERLEAWVVAPDERAAAVRELLEHTDRAEDVEREVTALLAGVAEAPACEFDPTPIRRMRGVVAAKSGVS